MAEWRGRTFFLLRSAAAAKKGKKVLPLYLAALLSTGGTSPLAVVWKRERGALLLSSIITGSRAAGLRGAISLLLLPTACTCPVPGSPGIGGTRFSGRVGMKINSLQLDSVLTANSKLFYFADRR